MSLVLSRNTNQSFYIGDDIVVTITNISGGQVKISIDAPDDVKIYREEIYKKIQQEKLEQLEIA